MLPDLHIGFSRGRSGGLVFPSLSEFSTVDCDPHSQRGFGIVNKAEIDIFLELSCFFNDPADIGNLISVPLSFLIHGYSMIMFQEENAGFINIDKYKSKSVGDRWWEMREEKNVENIWRYCYLHPTQIRSDQSLSHVRLFVTP